MVGIFCTQATFAPSNPAILCMDFIFTHILVLFFISLHELIKAHDLNSTMPPTRAITYADLEPSNGTTDLGSKTAAFLVVLTILCRLFCFILCIIAEATRSKVTWIGANGEGESQNSQCVYSGSGKTPLLCAAIAFVGLAVAMVVEHMYILVAISRTQALLVAPVNWDATSSAAKNLTWQAAFFLISAWVFFAVGEILLLIGISAESGHLKNWSRPKPSCFAIKQGLFTAAGIFALVTVFLAAGLYLTALRQQRLSQKRENSQQQMVEASTFYASPRRPTPIPTAFLW